MKITLKNFQKAVGKAIQANHQLGLPAYQREDDYIVAIYPNNRKVKLQKVGDLKKGGKNFEPPHNNNYSRA